MNKLKNLLEGVLFNHVYDEDTGMVVRDGLATEAVYLLLLAVILVGAFLFLS